MKNIEIYLASKCRYTSAQNCNKQVNSGLDSTKTAKNHNR